MAAAATTDGMITTLKHKASGASCQIHSTGATIISFKSANGRENLFCSSKAVMDGTKPIRGGIPIVFPIFGKPSHNPQTNTMPQHGYARVSKWTLKSSYDDDNSAGAVYTLALKDANEAGRGNNNCWSVDQAQVDGTDCLLSYEIRLEAKQLTTTLIVKNTGRDSFDFQCLLHTYLKVDNGIDISKLNIHGLGGYAITDKVSGDSGHQQSYDDDVVIQGEMDSVFIHPDDHPTIHAIVSGATSDGKTKIRVEGAGQVDENVAPVSCVVWNPGPTKAAAMSDFNASSEVNQMVCVEPGLVGHQPILNAGAEARLTQSIIIEE